MGLALPLRGYVLPKGHRSVSDDPNSSWNRQAHEEINNFAETVRALAPSLQAFIYPPLGSKPGLLDIEVVIETDEVERPKLRQLIASINDDNPGSIVVTNLTHLKWSSDSGANEHRQLLEEIVNRAIPVFTLWPGSGQSLARQIKGAGENAYFIAVDNYADNRQTLERHLRQLAKAE